MRVVDGEGRGRKTTLKWIISLQLIQEELLPTVLSLMIVAVFSRAKSISTPDDFSTGVIEALNKAAGDRGLSLESLLSNAAIFSYGTTVATNAFITGKLSKTGFITTKGTEDTLLIGRGAFQKTAGLTEAEIGDSALSRFVGVKTSRSFIRSMLFERNCSTLA
jgi:N-methylhydantoinase A/oxoprolinase/acetone carboxylase beta subunit